MNLLHINITIVTMSHLHNITGFVGVSSCVASTVPPLPVGEENVGSGLADWTIAVIIIAGVILVVAIVIGVVCATRKARDSGGQAHEPLRSGKCV